MAPRAKLKRKSYFVDERALKRAKKALGVKTEAEVIRLSVERVGNGGVLGVYEKNVPFSKAWKDGETLRSR